MKFAKNDKIRVKDGVEDPDFEGTIGGWTGIVLCILEDNYLIKWDEETIKKIPDSQKSEIFPSDEMVVAADDMEKVEEGEVKTTAIKLDTIGSEPCCVKLIEILNELNDSKISNRVLSIYSDFKEVARTFIAWSKVNGTITTAKKIFTICRNDVVCKVVQETWPENVKSHLWCCLEGVHTNTQNWMKL